MKIAVLGWGSLIWCPGALAMKERWRPSGPTLEIEFARISSDGRLTLVLHPSPTQVRTYWVLSACDSVAEARENLRRREGTRLDRIAHASLGDGSAVPSLHGSAICEWLQETAQLDAVIWTALETNWNEIRRAPFSCDDAVRYLEELRGSDEAAYRRAAEYIRNAPAQTQTPLRERLKSNKAFRPAELSQGLFEDTPAP
ncbi:MAG TPA: hypothetical protein VMF11_04505 [Candidatus Baltobacteraceae bacterium]|nr:hypothetical protein [Candidatus Baltobacteraceae bacterium]